MARIIQFEGRQITVPDDATDDEIEMILSSPPAAPVDSYAPPAQVPTVDPMDPYAPPTMADPVFTPPGRPRTGPEMLQIVSQAGLRGAADLAGSVYDLPNAMFMGGQWLGKTADEFSAFVGRQMGGDRRVPQDYEYTGMGEALGNVMGDPQEGAASLSDAIAETASETVDPFIQEQVLGRENYAPPMTREDMDGLEFIYDPIRFAAGSAGGGYMLANQAARALPSVGRHGVVDKLLDAYRTEPKMTIARDAAAGFGAGAGADVLPEDMPFRDILGPLLGAIGGSTVFGTALSGANLADNVFQNLTKGSLRVDGEVFSPAQVKEAARRTQAATQDPLTGNFSNLDVASTIEDQARYFDEQGLPVPDAGTLAAGNIPFQNLGKLKRTQNPNVFETNDARIKQAASERVGTLRDPGADQGAVARRAEGARLERMAPLTQEVGAREAAVNDVASGIAAEGAGYEPFRSRPEHYRTDASRRLDQNVVDESYLPARERKNALYDQVDPNRSEFVSIEPMRDGLQRLRNQINDFGPEALQMPTDFVQRIQTVLSRAAPDEDMMASVGELAGLRPFIATARANARKSGNFDLADNLGNIQTQIDGIIADHPAAAEANRNYRDNFAPTYRPGPGDEAAKFTKQIDREPFGEGGVPTRTQTPPERTADRFLSAPEKAAAVDRMIQASANPETGRRAVRDYFMSDFAASAFNADGTVNPQRANAWLQNNEPTLAQFPDMLRDFEQRVSRSGALRREAQDADTELAAARSRLQDEERTIERGAIGTLLNEDPYDVARDLLNSPRRGATRTWEEIERIVADDETASRGWRAALAEALWEKVTDTTKSAEGELVVNTNALAKLMKAKEGDLRRAFGDDFDTIEGSLRLVETLRNIPRGSIPGSQTAWNLKSLLVSPATEAALKLKYGVLKGGGILRSLRVGAEAFPTGEAKIERLIELAFFKPDLMADLLRGKLREIPRGNSNKYARGLQAGFVATNEGDNGSEEE